MLYVHKDIEQIVHNGTTYSRPKKLEGRTWTIKTDPQTEKELKEKIEFCNPIESAVPLSYDEKALAALEQDKAKVEIVELSRALAEVAKTQVAKGRASKTNEM